MLNTTAPSTESQHMALQLILTYQDLLSPSTTKTMAITVIIGVVDSRESSRVVEGGPGRASS